MLDAIAKLEAEKARRVPMMPDATHYTYRVAWSVEDGKHVATGGHGLGRPSESGGARRAEGPLEEIGVLTDQCERVSRSRVGRQPTVVASDHGQG